MTINLKQVIDAVESASEVYTDTHTGETVYLPDGSITGERDEALEELIENSPRGRFLRFPSKYDIHEYGVMASFVESMPPSAAREDLAHAIRGRGALRRFKSGIYYHWIERQWYDYRDQAYREIAIRWCKDEGIEYTEKAKNGGMTATNVVIPPVALHYV